MFWMSLLKGDLFLSRCWRLSALLCCAEKILDFGSLKITTQGCLFLSHIIRSLCALLGGLELCVYSSCYFVSRFCPKNLGDGRWNEETFCPHVFCPHVFRIGTGHGKHTIQTWHHVSRTQFWFWYPASTSGCLHHSTSYTSKEMTVDTYAWPTSTEPKQWVLTNSFSGTMLFSSVLCECVSW